MKLIESWKQSAQLLVPESFKSFILVTVKATIDIYAEMNKPHATKSNWMLAGIVAFLIILSNVIKKLYWFWLEPLVLNGMQFGLFFILVLALRASVDMKDAAYFKKYVHRFWFLFILTIAIGLTPIFAIPFLLMIYTFFLLFSFDSQGSLHDYIHALRNAGIMVLYNFPVCFAIELIRWLVGLIFNKFIIFSIGSWGGLTLAAIVYLIFVPMIVALYTNLYIKLFHNQPEWYVRH